MKGTFCDICGVSLGFQGVSSVTPWKKDSASYKMYKWFNGPFGGSSDQFDLCDTCWHLFKEYVTKRKRVKCDHCGHYRPVPDPEEEF